MGWTTGLDHHSRPQGQDRQDRFLLLRTLGRMYKKGSEPRRGPNLAYQLLNQPTQVTEGATSTTNASRLPSTYDGLGRLCPGSAGMHLVKTFTYTGALLPEQVSRGR